MLSNKLAMANFTPLKLRLAWQLADQNKRVAVDARRTPVVECVGELSVAADHERRLEVNARGTVVSACAFVAAHR